ncbi:trans-2-enoyl-CoA reductase (plasmid) [Vibrio sp. qd031]|uniref:enoyl-ACP reductase FabV n=1 Tax=Vibrio sp. qd031 TaxID=1603038 RepID=UPI000A0FB391|nr:enoyl-ACP reductase FabV [Vibrio sp. qd031]ORT52500.1 trans-2-enoyl-CoA reductase [Vibrio sp. qd031]
MDLEPIIKGVVAKNANPEGCRKALKEQIAYVKKSNQIKQGPKRVLILGASSGFGLAARTALTFGGSQADTIGVSFERAPSKDKPASAGWYNNEHFTDLARSEGRIAINIVGDAFSDETRQQVIEAIETYFEGEVDLIVYSLATGLRPKGSGEYWRSAIKTIGEPVTGATIMLENDEWVETTVNAATDDEIESTIKVMGGEDWESWVDLLINQEQIAQGCQSIAFSYIGSKLTHPIYHTGTLGRAKVDLHQSSHFIHRKLANFGGGGYAVVCKALVTKASVFIPAFTPYMLALYKVMKKKGTHEGCIEQMQRLFTENLSFANAPLVDGERLIRIDDLELEPSTQKLVEGLVAQMDASNFTEIGDYAGYKQEFLKLNGFDMSPTV